MARDLGVSTGVIFGAFSVALVLAAIFGPLAGRRIDLFGGRGVLAAGLRQGILMVPARFGQAAAPLVFALLMQRFGASAVLLSVALGLTGMAALLALAPSPKAEHA
jgi:hypothetical protein